MTITMDDFTERDGYFVRELPGDRAEVVRHDGYGFGSCAASEVDDVIATDREDPAAPTGYTIQDVFQSPPVEEPADANPEVVIEDEGVVREVVGGDEEETPAPKARRGRASTPEE